MEYKLNHLCQQFLPISGVSLQLWTVYFTIIDTKTAIDQKKDYQEVLLWLTINHKNVVVFDVRIVVSLLSIQAVPSTTAR